MKFLNSNLYNLLLSSVVIATVITSVFNYVISRNVDTRLLEIENKKRQTEIETYRYKNIQDAIKEINSIPMHSRNFLSKDEEGNLVQDKELFGHVIDKEKKRNSEIQKIYNKIKSLIDEDLTVEVSKKLEEEKRQVDLMAVFLYGKVPLPEGVDVGSLLVVREEIEKSIREAMVLQVRRLTKSTSDNQ